MTQQKAHRDGYGNILDAWSPPKGAGVPVGCIATSYTFSPVFFEEECLARFLQLETDVQENSSLYLIEREEKLCQAKCAALVDQHHCRGSRSMRWDLLSARVPGRIMHAKVSLLAWSKLVRVLVSSANLTEDGYRRNQEVFGLLDYYSGSHAPLECLKETVSFLRNAGKFSEHSSENPSPALLRWNEFLNQVFRISGDWGLKSQQKLPVQVHGVFTGPGRKNYFDRLNNLWPGNSSPNKTSVYSPFFDSNDARNRPAETLWKNLRQRGKAEVHYYVTAEEVQGEDALLIHAPETLRSAEPQGRSKISTEFSRILLDQIRPFHAKGMWFEDDRWAVYTIGSSNFTSPGLGLTTKKNVEANLAYIVDGARNKTVLRQLGKSWPDEEAIDLDHLKILWQPQGDVDEDSTGMDVQLPIEFSNVIYKVDDKSKAWIIFIIQGTPPGRWMLLTDDEKVFYSESRWKTQGKPIETEIAWEEDRAPSGFWVKWRSKEGRAWWPVNVESTASLPPPEDLRDLPLEILISILTSARPLHLAMREYIKRKSRGGDSYQVEEITDPHARVDVSNYLLQRTRRVSWALGGLRSRLERPAVNVQSLEWRLRGPVGVTALAEALSREAYSKDEKVFLLTELMLELARVEPQTTQGCLPKKTIRKHIRTVMEEIRDLIDADTHKASRDMKSYVRMVRKSVEI